MARFHEPFAHQKRPYKGLRHPDQCDPHSATSKASPGLSNVVADDFLQTVQKGCLSRFEEVHDFGMTDV